MNHAKFFAGLRARGSGVFGTSLSQKQVDGLNVLLAEADKRGTPLRHLAYILATAYHETAHTMQPIAEYGKGKGRKYGVPAGPYGQVYYGRGYVQLTWLANYEKAGRKIGVDLVRKPDLAMVPGIAATILFSGMEEGWFTGKKLSDYIGTAANYVDARRIVNGTDRAGLIRDYARAFEKALTDAGYSAQAASPAPAKPVPAPAPSPKPAAAPAAPQPAMRTLLQIIIDWLTGRK